MLYQVYFDTFLTAFLKENLSQSEPKCDLLSV